MGTNHPWFPIPHLQASGTCGWPHVFPFSSNLSVPHYPPYVIPAGMAVGYQIPWSLHESRLGFWYLDLAAGGSEKGIFNLHVWVLWVDTCWSSSWRPWGQHHGDRINSCWWGKNFWTYGVLTLQTENKPGREGEVVTYSIMCSTIQMASVAGVQHA
jgi:hypothetical protein